MHNTLQSKKRVVQFFFARRILPKNPKDFLVEQNQIFRSKFNVHKFFQFHKLLLAVVFSAFIISGGAVEAKKYMATASPAVYGKTVKLLFRFEADGNKISSLKSQDSKGQSFKM